MLTAQDVSALESLVVWLGLGIGLALGWVAQWGRFCTVGAISDWALLGNQDRLRMWLLAITVAILGTQLLILLGLIRGTDSFYVSTRFFWLSNILGGLIFGFGMVLASGCGSRALVRLGGGSLKALVVFIVMAVSAYITLRGILGVLRINSVEKIFIDLNSHQDLPSLVAHFSEISPLSVRSIVTLFLVASLLIFVFTSPSFRRQSRYWLTGAVMGLLVVGAWITTGYLGFIEEDPLTLEARYLATNTRSIEALTFVAPLAYWLELFMLWSDKSLKLTFSIATVSGILLGSLIHAKASGQFQWEGFKDRQDLADHLIGAVLMGVGGVVAFGCTLGQGISGLSMLAIGSLAATLSIVLGARLGLAWVERRD